MLKCSHTAVYAESIVPNALRVKVLSITRICKSKLFTTGYATFDKKNRAFTLAEILITIGIIGVVAAITIPNLITNHQKKVTATRLKQTYAQIEQAVKLSIAENGEIGTWDLQRPPQESFDQYIRPYISIIGQTKDTIMNQQKIPYKTLNGIMAHLADQQYKGDFYTILNGIDLFLRKDFYNDENRNSIAISIDLNGRTKRPNRLGKDWFIIYVHQTYGVYLYGAYINGKKITDRNVLLGECNKNNYGKYCGGLIQLDGWEIKKDYPW